MTDEIETLTARARQLEEENALLRSMQSPGGDEVDAAAENVLLRHELDLLHKTARGTGEPGEQVPLPRTLAEFNALPASARQLASRRMTPRQRDELLGRNGAAGRESYL